MKKKRERREKKLLKARGRLFKAWELELFKIQEKPREKFELGSLWDRKEGKQPNGGLWPRRNSCCLSAPPRVIGSFWRTCLENTFLHNAGLGSTARSLTHAHTHKHTGGNCLLLGASALVFLLLRRVEISQGQEEKSGEVGVQLRQLLRSVDFQLPNSPSKELCAEVHKS